MARIIPRLPVASVGGDAPTATISPSDWKRIEGAYRHQISDDLREAIRDRTNIYLLYAQLENAAKPVADAEQYLRAIFKATRALSDAFHLPCEADARSHVNVLIKHSFSDARLKSSDLNDSLHSFMGVLTSFQVACGQVKTRLEENRSSGFRPGATWNVCIRNLRSLLKERDLPSGYRKDIDKNKTGKQSDFVIFVGELQECIPSEYRRGARYGTSLTELISRACGARSRGADRSRNRVTKLKALRA